MVYSVSFQGDFEAGEFLATRFPDNVAVSGDAVVVASNDEAAEDALRKLAYEEWVAPETREPHDFEVEFTDSLALSRTK